MIELWELNGKGDRRYSQWKCELLLETASSQRQQNGDGLIDSIECNHVKILVAIDIEQGNRHRTCTN